MRKIPVKRSYQTIKEKKLWLIQALSFQKSKATEYINVKTNETMEDLENVPKQTGSAILDFDGKVVKVSQFGNISQEWSQDKKLRLRSFRQPETWQQLTTTVHPPY